MSSGFVVVIPARLSSSRLPDKPLALIGEKPLVVWCWERARASGADEVIVAVDDPRIADAVHAAGGFAVLTDPAHESGTDRIAEVAARAGWPADRCVVNLQGDEPLIEPELLSVLAEDLLARPETGMATCATPIRDAEEYVSPHAVKVVVDDSDHALYFSRAPIPHVRDGDAEPGALRHLGLYAYRAGTLAAIAAAPPGRLERRERLEQLRALAMGVRIYVRQLASAPPPGVDTPEDLARVRRELLS